MKKLLALLLAVVMIFALVACVDTGDEGGDEDGTVAEDLKYGGHLDIASININGRLDPCNVGGVYHWPNLIWESPLSRDANGNIAPGVCNFELSEDQLTLKLWVRDGMTFHDGSPVEIDDIVASMTRRGHKSPISYVVEYLVEEPTVENGVATFKFKKYSEKTMYYIASVNTLHAVLPKEFVEKYPGTTADGAVQNGDPADAIGTGPYKVKDERDGEWLLLERYEGYVKSDASLTGAAGPKNAYFDTIKYWNVSDSTATIISLLAGDIQAYNNVMEEYQDQFEVNNLAQTKQTGTKTWYIKFNNINQENQVHDDPNLRKAIVAALDFNVLNEFMWSNKYNITKGTSPALDAAYNVPGFTDADYWGAANIEAAKAYLAQSNLKEGEKVVYVSDANPTFAAMIQQQLEAAGIPVDVQVRDESSAGLSDANNNWNFTFWPYTAGATPSTVAATIFNGAWVSEDKDDLYDILCNTIPGSAEYMQAWEDMGELWKEECMAVYVGQEYAYWTHHKDLVVDYTGSNIYIWNWYWKNPAEHPDKNA